MISTKTKWVSTSAWRGYSQPIDAVAVANNTGAAEDSPCPSNVCGREINEFRSLLRKAGIKSKLKACETSNVFCQHVYVLVAKEDRERALAIAQRYEKQDGITLFYSV